MAKAHFIAPATPMAPASTVRLGQTSGTFNTTDEGKLVKLTAESRYELCAAGDPIEAVTVAVETGLSGGYSVGSVFKQGTIWAVADGAQATPGTGTLAVGDFVCAGTITARNTALTSFPKVCKATIQPGTTEAGVIGDVNDHIKIAMFPWRVVSLGTVGTGAVGTTVVVERV